MPHVVQPGETLWSIAAANNLTTRTVAAFNGLSENSQVVLGGTVMVPTTVEGYASLQKAGLVAATPAASSGRRDHGRRGRARRRPAGAGRLHRPRRRHAVRARGRRRACRISAIAAMNGLNPDGAAARRHRDQAAHRRAHARPRRPARAGGHGRARGRA